MIPQENATSAVAVLNRPSLPLLHPHLGSGWSASVSRFLATDNGMLLKATASLLLAFGLARTLLFKATKLPEVAYFSPSILAEMVQRGPTALVLILVGLCVWHGWSRLRWADLDTGHSLRLFIAVVAGTLAWTFSVYDFNLYYGQAHLTERLMLVALFLGSLWRPILIAPFLALVYTLTHQFNQPVSCTWTDKRVLFDVLSLFVGFLLVKLCKPATHERGSRPIATQADDRSDPKLSTVEESANSAGRATVSAVDFFYLVLCLHASNYVIPGWGKLVSGWPFVERLDNLFIASYLNGWLGFLSEEQVLGWARWIAILNPPMVWGSLVLELAGVVCLWNRRTCLALLLGWIALHGMICLTTGILFWKWIVLDLALASVLWLRGHNSLAELFSARRFWLSMAIVTLSPLLFAPPWLAWYDTELNEQYHLEVVTESGETYHLPRTFLVPYEVYFAQNKFHFLTHDKYVNGRYGTTPKWDVARRLDGRPSAESAESVREELGETEYSEQKVAAFDRFMQRYFANLNERGSQHAFGGWIVQPPQHIYSVVPAPRFAMQYKVARVRVIHERSLYQRDHIETLKREVVREIAIP